MEENTINTVQILTEYCTESPIALQIHCLFCNLLNVRVPIVERIIQFLFLSDDQSFIYLVWRQEQSHLW
jgi:hypothetical protein